MKNKVFHSFCSILLVFSLCLSLVSCEPDEPNTPSVEPEDPTTDIQPLGHDHIYQFMIVNPPSCGVEGLQAYVCIICGKRQLETTLDALDHSCTTISSWPDCTSPGVKATYCNHCWYREEETLDPIGHDWKSLTNHDLSTNELVITPFCARCYSAPMIEHRYRLTDIEKLAVNSSNLYGELDFKYMSDTGYKFVVKAPYYRLYCEGAYILIVRSTEEFSAYSLSNDEYATALDFYAAQGCTVFLEAYINADGCIQSVQP